MKAVILAGGKGTRLAEETVTRPKPMVEIGGMPILWHIMKIYAQNGVNEFIICLGHKGAMIKEWFINHRMHNSDMEIDLCTGAINVLRKQAEPWKVILAETGEDSLTGTRLAAIRKYLKTDEPFCMTYGDGVGNMDIAGAIEEHSKQAKLGKRLATITVVQPEGRFGAVNVSGDKATAFVEKPKGEGSWINAGFFICEPEVLDFIPKIDCMWEEQPLMDLANSGKLGVWRHDGFWRPMDTQRDKNKLEELWRGGDAPWKTWS